MGCVAPYMRICGPKSTRSPMVIRHVSRIVVSKLMNEPAPTFKFRPWSTEIGGSTMGSVFSKSFSSSAGSVFTGGRGRVSPRILEQTVYVRRIFQVIGSTGNVVEGLTLAKAQRAAAARQGQPR
ncbi:hypothetical protein BDV19DRAFT_212461 [Aspergillus venezuelensis]